MFELVDSAPQSAVIKVIGVGGGGGNAVEHMVSKQVSGVDFIATNTDAQALKGLAAQTTMQIGSSVTMVTLLPICMVVCAARPLRACASVFVAIKSTPLTCLETMCSTALPPPPPTPITLITALWGALSTSSNIVFSC